MSASGITKGRQLPLGAAGEGAQNNLMKKLINTKDSLMNERK